MSTKRALAHLSGMIEITERADQQIAALASTLRGVNAQIDAVLDDVDLAIEEVVIAEATGTERALVLTHEIVDESTVKLWVAGKMLAADKYTVHGGMIGLASSPPEGARVLAKYTTRGLRTQVGRLLETMSELDAADFLSRKNQYNQIVTWIEENYG